VRVIPGSFLGIGEYFVGRLYLCELSGGILDVAIIPIRVELQSLLPVRFLDSSRKAILVLGWLMWIAKG
jgi:hypothetical protein